MDSNQDEPKGILDSLRSHHVVSVHNPLSDDFTWTIGRSIATADPRYFDETMKTLRFESQKPNLGDHVKQPITIPAGKTMNLPGDVAKVYVKHLIDEILSRTDKKLRSNPSKRLEIEEMVVSNFQDLRSKLNTGDIQSQLDQQIADLNPTDNITQEASTNEPAFPELGQTAQGANADRRAVATAKELVGSSKATTPKQR